MTCTADVSLFFDILFLVFPDRGVAEVANSKYREWLRAVPSCASVVHFIHLAKLNLQLRLQNCLIILVIRYGLTKVHTEPVIF